MLSAGLRHDGVEEDVIFAQDPVFNALDVSLLSSLHVRVVTHPHGLARLDGTALLYAPHCERAFLYPALERAAVWPGLTIANSFEAVLAGPVRLSRQESELAGSWLARHDPGVFPVFDECPAAFNDLAVYWRKDEEDDQGAVRHDHD